MDTAKSSVSIGGQRRSETELGSSWVRALRLAERADGAPREGHDEEAVASAQRTVSEWRSIAGLQSDNAFHERLAALRLTPGRFVGLLTEEEAELAGRCGNKPPRWAHRLRSIVSSFADAPRRGSARLPASDPMSELFAAVLHPWVAFAEKRLTRFVGRLRRVDPNGLFASHTDTMLLPLLLRRLIPVFSRTFVLELNVARVEGRLTHDSAEARFEEYCCALCEKAGLVGLLREYPVLGRLLTERTTNWMCFVMELLGRLSTDWNDIRSAIFDGDDHGCLTVVDSDTGEPHRRGRAVALLAFESGAKLVYKPKSLEVDVAFQHLLRWLNERGQSPEFRTLRVIARDGYGWTQFAEDGPLASSEAASRFYRNQGGILALLTVLEATDFHFDNVIACGDSPVAVDLESLFHPRLESIQAEDSDLGRLSGMRPTVLRPGFLPQQVWTGRDTAGVDISALGGEAGQVTPFKVPSWEDQGTDLMRFIRRQIPIRGRRNHPTAPTGKTIDAREHVEEIVDGFSSTYTILSENKDDLIGEGGVLHAFEGVQTRVILRPTQAYGRLLMESWHPNLLRSALDRERILDHLWRLVAKKPYMARIAASELDDLWSCNFPAFAAVSTKTHLWSGTGKRFDDFFVQSSFDQVAENIARLGPRELQRQVWAIRNSFGAKRVSEGGSERNALTLREGAPPPPERCRGLAESIGDRLDTLALRTRKGVNWISPAMVNGQAWSLMPSDLSMYQGISGIGLFASHLASVTKSERFAEIADRCADTVATALNGDSGWSRSIGGFTGCGGALYFLSHHAVTMGRPDHRAPIARALSGLGEEIDRDRTLDVINGAAGCALGLLSVYRAFGNEQSLELAIRCSQRLVATAERQREGRAWHTLPQEPNALTGFSHGVAGIAYALLEVAAHSGHREFTSLAADALAFERSVFDDRFANWPDLREIADDTTRDVLVEQSESNRFMWAWCHGAPGVGLSRIQEFKRNPTPELRKEIVDAVSSTLELGFGSNHCLCHGDFGNLELVREAAAVLDDASITRRLHALAASLVRSLDDGWCGGIPRGLESPGLMMGMAGTGYSLLRQERPDEIPNVLRLEAPIRSV